MIICVLGFFKFVPGSRAGWGLGKILGRSSAMSQERQDDSGAPALLELRLHHDIHFKVDLDRFLSPLKATHLVLFLYNLVSQAEAG